MPVVLENVPDVFLIILAADRDHDATLVETNNLLLKSVVRCTRFAALVQRNAIQATFDDDAAPKRIVAIQDQTLLRHALYCAYDSGYIPCIEIEETCAERRL